MTCQGTYAIVALGPRSAVLLRKGSRAVMAVLEKPRRQICVKQENGAVTVSPSRQLSAVKDIEA